MERQTQIIRKRKEQNNRELGRTDDNISLEKRQCRYTKSVEQLQYMVRGDEVKLS